ncbi:hypothetical protein L226DRAFT_479727 [Lentinus tigrinus ALCF2SS1-7]|uniref:LYC1 C-terminal domain-containing protein n=1 Tax=Lentinus tigrinus ALCF2SS1-6 TaxID=1328759 RepID=A0A5C2SQ43_9APHY|nr:hypothetical protein L227DRAFT_590909 [Lentinus tigrinus ALCF2SS1-6]RPD78984.1 hypothetical protein L226DRAFT_479727 [Lentinus tigrinus ALCF2SS1-7]
MTVTTELTLADLSLFPATAEQTHESRTRHAVQWSRGQALEEYIHRDVVMEGDEHAANGNLITWVLAPRNDPTTLDFMCSCETFRRAALVTRAQPSSGGDAMKPKVEEVTAYGVASVYTPPKSRKRGYARHMMRLLHWVLASRSALPPTFPREWGAPPDVELLRSLGVANAQFSVLYSDVGRDFYRSCGTDPMSHNGWMITGAIQTFWELDASEAITARKPDINIVRLSESDVVALYDHDARWMKEDLARHAMPGRTQFTFLPDRGVGAFNVRRTMDFTPDLQPVLPSKQWGAFILPDGARTLVDALEQSRPLPFVSWTLDLKTSPRTLVVSRLRADEKTLPVLLEELLAAARDEKVEKVEFWYMRPELRALAESKGWKTEERIEHLPAVKWYGDEKEEEIEWVYNEKFCWC